MTRKGKGSPSWQEGSWGVPEDVVASALKTGYLVLVTALAAATRNDWSRAWVVALAGEAADRLSREKSLRCRRGISEAGVAGTEAEVRNLSRASFRSFWEDLFWIRPTPGQRRALQDAVVSGTHRLDLALTAGRGAILWESNAFGLRNAGKLALSARGYRVVQVHSVRHLGGLVDDEAPRNPWRNRWVRRRFDEWSREFADRLILLDDSGSLAYTRAIREALLENRLVSVAADGNVGQARREVPMLGRLREFSPGMVSLAKACSCPIYPLFAWRDESGRLQVTVEVELPRPDGEGRDSHLDRVVSAYARILERRIREHPGQYHGWHAGRDLPPDPEDAGR